MNERKRADGRKKTHVWTEYKTANLSIPDENTNIRVQAERMPVNSVQVAQRCRALWRYGARMGWP